MLKLARIFAINLAVLAMAACGSASTSLSVPTSNTSPLPSNDGTAAERSALVSLTDVKAIPSAPVDITVSQPAPSDGLYNDPDPRGPCGAHVKLPDYTHAAIISLQASNLSGSEIVADSASSDAAAALVSAQQVDIKPGCPAFTSTTNTGSVETSTFDGSLPMPDTVDQAVGFHLTIANNGTEYEGYLMILRSKTRIATIQIIGVGPVDTSFTS